MSAYRPARAGGTAPRPRQPPRPVPSGPARLDRPTPTHPADQAGHDALTAALFEINRRRIHGEEPTTAEELALAAAVAAWRGGTT